ncbi:MAG: energy-coupling factor transporter ATPase [Bacillota bacterium]
MPVIKMENVWHSYYPGTPIQTVSLSGVSLDVERGEFLALIGHTGSGKSTVLQHMNGLILPDRGRVLVNGSDTGQKKFRKSLWSVVGLVFQYPERQFFEETVYREVSFGPKNLGINPEDVNNRVSEALDMVGISRELAKKVSPYALSGGEQRRVALASVLAVRPAVLLMDEPTAGMDSGGRRKIFEALSNLRKERGTTVVMASHSMDDVARLADRVAVLKKGSLLMAGGTRQVFSNSGVIKEAGLDLPFPCEVVNRLNQIGFCMESTALTIEEALNGIQNEIARRMTLKR